LAAFGWFVSIASPVVMFPAAVAAAAAWLEKRVDNPFKVERSAVADFGRRRFLVYVIATTLDSTREALLVAQRLTGGLDAEIVMLVPRLASHGPLDIESPERAALIDAHHALAVDLGVHANVLFCACHRYDDVVHQMLGRSSLLIVGGRKRIWWPTAEERLVSRLAKEGYPVVFAQVGTSCLRAPGEARTV
jgi:hypothetical protein